MREVAGGGGPGRQHDDARIFAARERDVAVVDRLEEARELLDAVGDELVGQAVAQRDAVLEGIPAAHRRLAAVLENPPAAVRRAPDVGGVVVQAPAAAHRHAVAGPEELGIAEHQRRGQVSVQHQALLAVAVREHGVEQPGTLHQACLEAAPVLRRDQQRQRVEPPRPRGCIALPVDVVGEPVLVKDPLDPLPARVHFDAAQRPQRIDQLLPVWPDLAIGRLHLVVRAGQGPIRVEQRCQRLVRRTRQRLGPGVQAGRSSLGAARRMSSVSGNSGFNSSAGSRTGPGECPSSENRASRRLSAS